MYRQGDNQSAMVRLSTVCFSRVGEGLVVSTRVEY